MLVSDFSKSFRKGFSVLSIRSEWLEENMRGEGMERGVCCKVNNNFEIYYSCIALILTKFIK